MLITGDEAVVTAYVNQHRGEYLEWESFDGLLGTAVWYGLNNIVVILPKLLPSSESDPVRYDRFLFDAARFFNPDVIPFFLSLGANPNAVDAEGKTPLHHAARYGETEAVKLLLDGGASPNMADAEGSTPLHCAAHGTMIEVVKLLLAAGASPDQKDNSGKTPIDCSASRDITALLKSQSAESQPPPDKPGE